MSGDTASTTAFWWQKLVAHLAGDEIEETAVAAKGPEDDVLDAHCSYCSFWEVKVRLGWCCCKLDVERMRDWIKLRVWFSWTFRDVES